MCLGILTAALNTYHYSSGCVRSNGPAICNWALGVCVCVCPLKRLSLLVLCESNVCVCVEIVYLSVCVVLLRNASSISCWIGRGRHDDMKEERRGRTMKRRNEGNEVKVGDDEERDKRPPSGLPKAETKPIYSLIQESPEDTGVKFKESEI